MGPSFIKEILLKESHEDVNDLIQKTFIDLGWRYTKTKANHYKSEFLDFGMVWGLGENFTIININNQTLSLCSKSYAHLFDLGKNRSNVEKFEKYLMRNLEQTEFKITEINNKEINKQSFAEIIAKLYKLFIAEILTEEEFKKKKLLAIKDLRNTNIEIEFEDFLISLIDLKNKNIITQEEVNSIKNILNNRG